jgi:AhpD family alkylhydroperoxidase
MADHDTKEMKELLPDLMTGFSGLFTRVFKDGALSVREKELIALGLGVAARCKPCIRAHVEKCLAAGAAKEQILEAASVAVVMGGGPAFVHVPEVIKALKELGK